MITHQELERVFKSALDSKLDAYIGVTIPGQTELEYIVNKNASLLNKLDYYKSVYDEMGVHKRNNQIKIMKVGIIDFFMDDANEEDAHNG